MHRFTNSPPASPARRRTLLLGTVLSAMLLSACSIPSLRFPGVYKVPVQQGNLITQAMIDQLEPGMTRRQVIFVMGTPIVRDPFHQDRWDYVYNFEPGGGIRGQERITIYFEDDQLSHFTGDFRPSEPVASAPAANP